MPHNVSMNENVQSKGHDRIGDSCISHDVSAHRVKEGQDVSVIDGNQCGSLPPEVNTDTESQPDIPASGVAGTHRVKEGQDVSVIDGNQCGSLPLEVNTDTESQPDIPANTGSSALTGEDNESVHKIQLADKRIFENTLRVNIGKARAAALVDTGATVSCISNNFLNTINPHYVRYLQPDIMTVFGVGNMAHEVSAKVELNFVIDGTEFTHTFHALHNGYNMILGMDFLTDHGAVLNFKEAEITLDGKVFQMQPPHIRSSLLKTTAPVLISAFTATSVPARLSKSIDANYLLLSGARELNLVSTDLDVTPTIISCEKDDITTMCRIINTSATPVCIPAGSVVAVAQTVAIANVLDFDECVDLEQELQDDELLQENEGDNFQLNFENAKLTDEEKRLVTRFVQLNIRRFAAKLEDLGRNSDNPHLIKTGTSKPISLRYYRTSPVLQREIERQIKELLRHGLIEPSRSKWRSPVLLVKKPDSTFRLVCDYRNLNKVTEKESFPLPRLEDVWDLIGEKKPQYFSVLDLSSGFWQLELDEETKHKTSFVTRCGQYQWNVLPFGLTNSPITFQQTMNQVLGDLILTCCIVYVDDIVVFSPDLETHLQDLQQVFDRLEQAGLKLKLSKCRFAVSKVKYLGHILSPEGISPNPEKVDVIKNYPTPKNVKQVRQFLGLCNYYRRFQKDYSQIAKPLQNLTKKDSEWVWSPACQRAFETLRNNLVTAPMLKYADMEKPFILTTDASSVALGYVLSQVDDEGVERVIEFAGRALRNSELNYSVTDKEGLGVVEGFNHFHSYLYGNFTTVITDHSALTYIQNNTKITGRVARWAILLQNYDYEIIHRPGAENTNADAISRLENLHAPPEGEGVDLPHADILVIDPEPVEIIYRQHPREYPIFRDAVPVPETIMQINDVDLPALQQSCPEIGPIYRYHLDGTLPDDKTVQQSLVAHAKEYGLRSDVLHHIHEKRSRHKDRDDVAIHQIVIPKILRPSILSEYHDSIMGGHQGFTRTYECIKQKYFWPRMYSDIDKYLRSCTSCQQAKTHYQQRNKPPLTPLPIEPLFSRWHIDFLGPLRTAHDGSKYILLVVESFSRWCEAFPLKSADAVSVAKVLYTDIFTRYGAPVSLVSDRGQQFMSKLVQALCAMFSVRRKMTSSYHPQTNSACERMNSYILSSLRAYVRPDQLDWPGLLPGIMMAYRHTPATNSTEFSPFYILFNQTMKTPLDTEIDGELKDVPVAFRSDLKSYIKGVEVSRKIARDNIARHQRINKAYSDRHANEVEYEINDLVWVHNPEVPIGLSKKLRRMWVGPYRVCDIGPNHTYRLQNCETMEISPSMMNASRFKPVVREQQSALRELMNNGHRQTQRPTLHPSNAGNVSSELEQSTSRATTNSGQISTHCGPRRQRDESQTGSSRAGQSATGNDHNEDTNSGSRHSRDGKGQTRSPTLNPSNAGKVSSESELSTSQATTNSRQITSHRGPRKQRDESQTGSSRAGQPYITGKGNDSGDKYSGFPPSRSSTSDHQSKPNPKTGKLRGATNGQQHQIKGSPSGKPPTIPHKPVIKNSERSCTSRSQLRIKRPTAESSHPPFSDPEQSKLGQDNRQRPPICRVHNLKNNGGKKFFLVEYQGVPKKEWISEGFVHIPQTLIDECLVTRTWQGQPRKKRPTKAKHLWSPKQLLQGCEICKTPPIITVLPRVQPPFIDYSAQPIQPIYNGLYSRSFPTHALGMTKCSKLTEVF